MALAWGRGERMLALDPLPEQHVVLVVPRFRVATADAYGWVAADRGTARGTARRTPQTSLTAIELHPWHLANWSELTRWCGNDFEPVISARYPAIITILSSLRTAGATLAGMTGSGSTLFGIFDVLPAKASLETLQEALRHEAGGELILTKTAIGVEGVR
jgi:4-diphosphocytidyl-2-C-methyl-D-erythritol kinase